MSMFDEIFDGLLDELEKHPDWEKLKKPPSELFMPPVERHHVALKLTRSRARGALETCWKGRTTIAAARAAGISRSGIKKWIKTGREATTEQHRCFAEFAARWEICMARGNDVHEDSVIDGKPPQGYVYLLRLRDRRYPTLVKGVKMKLKGKLKVPKEEVDWNEASDDELKTAIDDELENENEQ